MRSDNVTKGSERAPNRSLFYALGYTPEELERPLIGVVSAYSEIVPGHMNLDKIAEAVKAGVQMAGGTPILIPAIGVCDGIAMGHVGMKYSLASRELICDSVETMLMAHQLDGLVLVPNCDKIVPGMVMAAVRMDVPAVVCSGGPMLAGTYGGEEVSLSKMFEAVGAYKAGMITDEQLEDCTCNCCPSCGSCSGMYTANSMNCLCEAIGIALPGNGTIPAVYSKRLQLAKHAGMAVMEMVRKGIGSDARIGNKFLYPGCGYGGSCFPKDVKALAHTAREHGYTMQVIEAVERVNEQQKGIVFEKLQTALGDLRGKVVAIWGLAFKPETDDMREAPATVVIGRLLDAGAEVRAYDPVAIPEAQRRMKDKPIRYVRTMYEAAEGADAVALMTEWKELRMPDWSQLNATMRGEVIVDGRNIFDKEEVLNAGLRYYGIGK